MACGGFLEPLNLQCLLVNTFAGGMDLFIIIAFIAIGMIAATFKMPNYAVLPMFVLFGVIMSAYIGTIYLLIVLLVGLVTFFAFTKLLK